MSITKNGKRNKSRTISSIQSDSKKSQKTHLISIFNKKLSLKTASNNIKKSERVNKSSFLATTGDKNYHNTDLKKHFMFDEYLKASKDNKKSNDQIENKKRKPLFFQKKVKLAPIKQNEPEKSEEKKPKKKVFITSKAYGCIKQGLLDRNWVENTNLKSENFDLKFVVKSAHINYKSLNKKQVVNHFDREGEFLTTKVGLTKTLKNLEKYYNDNCDNFYPKCFYTHSDTDFSEFIRYFKFLHAENILKKFLNFALREERDNEIYQNILEEKLETAIIVIKRRLKLNFGEFFNPEKDDEIEGITSEEWSILANEDINSMFINLLKEPEKATKYIRTKFSKEEKAERSKKKKKTNNKKDQDTQDSLDLTVKMGQIEGLCDKLTKKELEVKSLLETLSKKFPQTKVNGVSNIWILKPAGLSRGRGIRLYSNIKSIMNHLKSSEHAWVIQKYLENSLLYKNKKLDIRQWVLVTSFDPLTIWFYEECYIRISSAEFTLNNLKDRYIHLTNNSVNKKSDNFVKEEGFMSQDEMKAFLEEDVKEGTGEEIFGKIQAEMKRQVKKSLMCCQESIENRKNSCSVYGYDFCIDQDLGVWLIEVNASPDFSFSSVIFSTFKDFNLFRMLQKS